MPCITIPAGYQPRAALGFLLFPVLRMLEQLGLTEEPLDGPYGGYAHFNKGYDFGVPVGTPVQAVVLQAYGVGNGPDRDAEFLAALSEATERGVVVVDCSQCLTGHVDLDSYAAGSALANAGVISGYDLTVEAAVAKLTYLFSRGYDADKVKLEMQRDLRGEMTVTS